MKNKLEIFKNAQDLLEEQSVQDLLNYCEHLEDELVELKFKKNNNKELILLDMIREVIKGCNALEKEQMEHARFRFEAPNYIDAISNLKRYILKRCEESKIWL